MHYQPNWNFEVSLGEIQNLLVAAGIPIPNVGVKRTGKTDTVSVQITKEPTIDSQFDKLFRYIEPALQYLEVPAISVSSTSLTKPSSIEDKYLLTVRSSRYRKSLKLNK